MYSIENEIPWKDNVSCLFVLSLRLVYFCESRLIQDTNFEIRECPPPRDGV
jgi:hypothetical protein